MGKTRGRRREKKEKKQSAFEGGAEQPQVPIDTDLDADFIPLDDAPNGSFAELTDDNSINAGDLPLTGEADNVRDNRASFFGLLDKSELEYFKNAESMLATNALTRDEREPFIDSIFAEAKGKELKLATNQVCSKLLERLTQLANEEQMQQLVQAFEPFSVDLSFQKFSSHCLEAILGKGAGIESCQSFVASAGERLTKFIPDLMNDTYGSHVLRTVLLVFAGLRGDMRSKKSRLARKHTSIETETETAKHAEETNVDTPENMRKVVRGIVKTVLHSADAVEARTLAIHPVASAVIQALVLAEASLMSSYKLVTLILAESPESKQYARGFVNHCLTDPVGSHFLETAIKVLPAKKASKFIQTLPLAKLATSENEAANYLVQAIITKSNLSVSQKRDIVRNDLMPVLSLSPNVAVAALEIAFDETAKHLTEDLDKNALNLQDARKTALYERLSKYPPFVEKAADVVAVMSDENVKDMALHPTESYVLQYLLQPTAPLISRRKLVNKLVPLIPALAVNAYGSHIVDQLWPACYKLKFVRERIASELLKVDEQVKHSPYGRKVWKNWHMEKYAHRRHEWWQAVKDEEDMLRSKLEPEAVAKVGPNKTVGTDKAGKKPLAQIKRRKVSA